MKKFKKILAVLLAVAAVCALMMTPASAAMYANNSDSSSGGGDGYNWSGTLTRNGNSATARMVVSPKPSGAAPAFLSATVTGVIYDLYGGFTEISRSSGPVYEGNAIAVATGTKSGAVRASCECYAFDTLVSHLNVN